MSDKMQLTTGEPVPADGSHRELRPDGQQKGYVVLSPEERAKGFVKPVRRSYTHVGAPPAPANLRDLTEVEELARAGKRCGAVTTMSTALAETYARDPHFYSGTFCVACGKHYPLNEFTWEDGEPMDTALQAEWQRTEGERRRQARRVARQNRIAQLRSDLARLEAETDE